MKIKNKWLLHLATEKVWAIGFAIVFLGGAYLRFRALTFQSYWDDELFSVAASDPHNTLRQVVRLTINDVHPPLFQALLWCWFKVCGFSEMTGRLFPAIFGTLSIPIMFFIGREIGDRKTGFICSLICAVNVFHLHYSQEVRSYSLLFFLSALSLLLFIRVARRPTNGNLFAYIAAATALAYTHFFGIFILIGQATFFFLVKTTSRGELKRAGVVIGITMSVMLSPLIPLVFKNAGITAFWISRPTPDFAIDYFREYFGSSLIAAGAAIALLYGAICYSKTPSKKETVQLLLLCIASAFMLPYARSLIGVPMLTSRNTIVALPAIFALVAIGFEQIADKVSQAMALLAFSTLSLLLIFHQPPYYNTVTKPQIREAAQALIASHPDPEKVYAAEEVVRNFNVYFSLYNAPFRAQPVSRLYQDYREKNLLPVKFWLIEGRVLGPLFDQVMPDPKAHMLQKTEFIGAGFMSMELTP